MWDGANESVEQDHTQDSRDGATRDVAGRGQTGMHVSARESWGRANSDLTPCSLIVLPSSRRALHIAETDCRTCKGLGPGTLWPV